MSADVATAGPWSAREPLLWLVGTIAVYWLATHHLPIDQKHYVYMAEAFLRGSLSVSNVPDDLVETIHYHGGIYFGYGVMPAIVLMPFVALWGRAFDPAIAGILIGALTVVVTNRIFFRLALAPPVRTWLTALFAFGTVHFHASIWGTTWFFMQVVSIFFLSIAVYAVIARSSALLIGVCFGAAVLSRNAVLVAAPFFVLMLAHSQRPRKEIILFGVALSVVMLANAGYNLLRFGNPLENGYVKAWNGPFGLFALRYLPHNVYTYLFKPPEWLGHFPYLRPSLDGMSLFLTTPAFLALLPPTLKMLRRDRLVLACWIAVAAVGGLYLVYFWSGFAEFGVRYTLDYTPFLLLLAACASSKGLPRYTRALIILSIAINIWGIAWWRFSYFVNLAGDGT